MVVFPFPTSFYGNNGTKFPEKSAFDPRSVFVNTAGTMTRKLSGQKLAVLGAGKLGGILLDGRREAAFEFPCFHVASQDVRRG